MRLKKYKSATLRLIGFAVCVFAFTVVIVFLQMLIPRAVSYSVINNSASSAASSTELIPNAQFSVFDITKIESEGPFTIKAQGDGIYVFDESHCLYKIRTLLSDLPINDKSSVEKGFEAADKGTLCELINHLES